MAKSPQPLRQINFKVDQDLFDELQYIADALGLDLSNLARMIIRENKKPYRERADRVMEDQDEHQEDEATQP